MVLRELVPGDIIYGTDFFGIDDLYKKKDKNFDMRVSNIGNQQVRINDR